MSSGSAVQRVDVALEAIAKDAPPAAPESPTAAIARNAFYLVLSQAAATVLSVGLNAVLGRVLGAVDFGVMYLVTSICTLAYVFIDAGQGLFIIREVANRPRRSGDLLGTSAVLWSLGAVVVGLLATLATRLLGYDARTTTFVAVMMAAALPPFLADGFARVFRGIERMDCEAMTSVAGKVLTAGITVAWLAMGGRIVSVLMAEGIAGLGTVAIAWTLFRRLRLGSLRASRETARDLMRGGLPFMSMLLAITAQASIDAVVLSRLATSEAVGWFGAARTIMNALITPASILGAASFPRLSRATDPLQFRRELRAALRPLLGVGALACVGTYLFAGFAIGLVYGAEKFGPSTVLLQVFAPVLMLFFADVLLGGAVMVHRPARLALVKVCAIGVATTLDFLLIPWCQARYGNGGIGILLALAASEALMVAGSIALLPRGALDVALLLDLGRAVAAGACTLGILRLLPAMPGLLGIPLCILVFAGLSIPLGVVSPADLALARAAVARRLGASRTG